MCVHCVPMGVCVYVCVCACGPVCPCISVCVCALRACGCVRVYLSTSVCLGPGSSAGGRFREPELVLLLLLRPVMVLMNI